MRYPLDYQVLFPFFDIHETGLTGKDIVVAILDTGIFDHEDFLNIEHRILSFKDFVNQKNFSYDDCGHGTHVAGIIGSSGFYHNQPIGIAPECKFVILKVLGSQGEGRLQHMLQGLQWILDNHLTYKIRIVNISIGSLSQSVFMHRSKLIEIVNALWKQGVLVVCAAGNNGPRDYSVTTPGISRKIITVGSCDDDFNYSSRNYSGRGPTSTCISKPDLVAPGTNIYSCSNSQGQYARRSGTSMSTPFVSGVLALYLQKNPSATPKDVKIALYETSITLNKSHRQQGWGLINPRGLLSF